MIKFIKNETIIENNLNIFVFVLPLMNFISRTVHQILKSLTPKNCKFFSLFLCIFPEFLGQLFKLMHSHFSLKVFTFNEFYLKNHLSDFCIQTICKLLLAFSHKTIQINVECELTKFKNCLIILVKRHKQFIS